MISIRTKGNRTDHALGTRDLDEPKTRLSTTEAKVRYFVLIIPQGQVSSRTKPSDEWLSEFAFFILEIERGTYGEFS